MKKKSVRQQAKKVHRVRPRWTIEQESMLRGMHKNHSNAEIAKAIKRSVTSVVFKAHRLQLSKSAKRLAEMGRANIEKRWGKKKK
jgi:hypothetical protein